MFGLDLRTKKTYLFVQYFLIWCNKLGGVFYCAVRAEYFNIALKFHINLRL
jgi:hypothetical protein